MRFGTGTGADIAFPTTMASRVLHRQVVLYKKYKQATYRLTNDSQIRNYDTIIKNVNSLLLRVFLLFRE